MQDASKLPQGNTPFEKLVDLMARLRDPETGCPWDVEQTFQTIAPYTIEEAYEVLDAIEQGDMKELREELGDLCYKSFSIAKWPRKPANSVLMMWRQRLMTK